MCGALYWAKQFMSILDQKLESERPLSAAEEQPVMPRSVETLLPQCEPGWGLGSLGPVLSSMVSQVSHLLPSSRPGPLAPLLRAPSPAPGDQDHRSRSHFLRGWLSEEETRELLAQCCEDDISLQGLVLAVCLAATARVACPGLQATLRASVVTNMRQHLSPAPRHGALSAPHEVTWRLEASVEDREQLWALAHSLKQHLTQAKADRLALRQVRSYAKMTATHSDIVFSESPDKITSEMSVTVLGDLGNIFRRESSVSPYESWSGQPLQVSGQARGRIPDGGWAESWQCTGSQCTRVPGPPPVHPDLLHLHCRHQHRPLDQRRDNERPEDVCDVRRGTSSSILN